MMNSKIKVLAICLIFLFTAIAEGSANWYATGQVTGVNLHTIPSQSIEYCMIDLNISDHNIGPYSITIQFITSNQVCYHPELVYLKYVKVKGDISLGYTRNSTQLYSMNIKVINGYQN